MFGGGEPYKVRAVFESAGQLVPGNQVRVGGQPIGTIADIELDDAANAVVTMELKDTVTPLHEDTTATIRAASLSGITSRYISLKPGPNDGDEIEDGGRIGVDQTTSPVDIDVLFNTLDEKTRGGLRDFTAVPERSTTAAARSRARASATSARSSPAPRGSPRSSRSTRRSWGGS